MKNLKVKKKEAKNLNFCSRIQTGIQRSNRTIYLAESQKQQFYEYKCKILKNEEAEKNKREAKRKLDDWKSQCMQGFPINEHGFRSLSKYEIAIVSSVSEKLFSSEKIC